MCFSTLFRRGIAADARNDASVDRNLDHSSEISYLGHKLEEEYGGRRGRDFISDAS